MLVDREFQGRRSALIEKMERPDTCPASLWSLYEGAWLVFIRTKSDGGQNKALAVARARVDALEDAINAVLQPAPLERPLVDRYQPMQWNQEM